MRTLNIVAGLVAMAMLVPLPAMATDQGEAVKLCGKNPNCNLEKIAGGVSITIEGGTRGPNAVIFCPDQGACVCSMCPSIGSAPGSVGTAIRLGMTPKRYDEPASSSSSGGETGPVSSGGIENAIPSTRPSGQIN